MPPPLLIDLAGVDLAATCLSQRDIYEILPHRYEFMLLDGACVVDRERRQAVVYREVRESDWWVRGHIPGRPLLPGVLMLEMAGQAAAVLAKLCGGYEGFIGYGGVDQCKFRDAITPPARLYVLAAGLEQRSRRIVCQTQGVSDGKLIFEAIITGVVMR
ncbi:MAG: beta-hydroxyacyl-ACP dehydratase [Planctomycetes bacterium]|nr:beta-hydroxyacyl-ACP dehydratase [Planctomycetota bacterium]